MRIEPGQSREPLKQRKPSVRKGPEPQSESPVSRAPVDVIETEELSGPEHGIESLTRREPGLENEAGAPRGPVAPIETSP